MYLKNIKLQNFRNYDNLELDFSKDINIFYGNNAQGKTNLLEAIYLCSFGKSFRTSKDNELIKMNKEFATIELNFEKKQRQYNIRLVISKNKTVFINGIKAKKLSQLLSNLNIVLFSPTDIEIINSSPQRRRKFIDVLIGQLRPNYIHILNKYNKIVEQRNQLMKKPSFDTNVLDIYDEQLSLCGFEIFKYRKYYIEQLNEFLKIEHKKITNSDEVLRIEYLTTIDSKENFLKQLKDNRQNDIYYCQTSKGIHRDDLKFILGNIDLKIYGSQGQKRTAVLALKLSELSTIKAEIGENPILLLDDFMSELDKIRISNFIKQFSNSQVCITCTDKFNLNNENVKLFNIEKGKINKV